MINHLLWVIRANAPFWKPLSLRPASQARLKYLEGSGGLARKGPVGVLEGFQQEAYVYIGEGHLNDAVKAARPGEGTIQGGRTIGGSHDNHPRVVLKSIHLRQ